jgi:hypothetical protein
MGRNRRERVMMKAGERPPVPGMPRQKEKATERAISQGQLTKLRIIGQKLGFGGWRELLETISDELDIRVQRAEELPFDRMHEVFLLLESGKYGRV